VRKAFVDSLVDGAEKDSRVMLLVGDLGYGVVEPFSDKYPDRFVNAGVSEQNMTGVAAGLALSGKVVFTYSIANFPTIRALEQIRNDIVYHRLAVTIVAVGTGFSYGVLGYSHHGVEDISILRSLPGMRVLSPSTDSEVANCVKLILSSPAPTYLRLDKDPILVQEPLEWQDVSKPRKRFSRGSEIVVLSTGSIAGSVDDALESLPNSFGLKFAHYSLCQIKPMKLSLDQFDQAKLILTVEEHTLSGGFGSAVLEELEGTDHISKVRRIAIPDVLSEVVGSASFLRKESRLDSVSLAKIFTDFAKEV
jgi:transketolase